MSKQTWKVIDIGGKKALIPNCNDSEKKLESFKFNQVVSGNISGVMDQRSVKALNTYWKACEVFAELYAENGFSTKEYVDFKLRVALKFIDPTCTIVTGDKVVFKYRSISFAELSHIESVGYFNEAYELMADKLGVTKDEFILEVKRRCS